MTYNFDPERWYDIERAAIDRELRAGRLTARGHGEALESLQARYERMLDRLDGAYRLPPE